MREPAGMVSQSLSRPTRDAIRGLAFDRDLLAISEHMPPSHPHSHQQHTQPPPGHSPQAGAAGLVPLGGDVLLLKNCSHQSDR